MRAVRADTRRGAAAAAPAAVTAHSFHVSAPRHVAQVTLDGVHVADIAPSYLRGEALAVVPQVQSRRSRIAISAVISAPAVVPHGPRDLGDH